jgi:hypothetical protein
MFSIDLILDLLRDRSRHRRKPARRRALMVEGLEDRNLLSFSAPASFHFNRDPAAVAVADFTRSGHQDLAVIDGIGQTLTILLGNGDGTFRNAGSLPGGGLPVLATGDFTGDGIPDLVEGTHGGVRLLLGNGDGTFRTGVSLTFTPDFTSSIAVGDFFGDGKLDLIVASTEEGLPQEVFELRGNGDGTFQTPVDLGFKANFVVAGDVKNHGKLDLIDDGAFRQPELRVGNGDGTFQAPIPFAPGLPLTVTDVNGDGIPDLVFATSTGISERLGNGDGTFQDPINITLPANTPGAVLGVGDFNNDGQLDVVIRNRPFQGQSHALSVLLNNGNGSFITAPAFAAGANTLAIAAGPFTSSGLPDIVTVGFDGLAHVLFNNGDGNFRSGPTLSAPGIGSSVVVGDFRGDGQSDIAVFTRSVTDTHSRVDVFLGNGDGTFQPARVFDLGDGTGSDGEIVAGDFDDDGHLDLAVLFRNNTSRHSFVDVLLGNGDGTFRAAEPHPVDGEPTGLAVADFNRDGKLDLVVSNGGDALGNGSQVSVLLGNGDGTFQDPSNIPVPGGPFSVAVGDFKGDGIPDIVTANLNNGFFPGSVSVLRGNGDGTFAAPANYQVGVRPAAVIVGHFQGDGILDIVVVNAFSNSVSVLRGNGDGTFQNAVDYLVGVDPRSLVAADFNGDNALDLAVANDHSNDVSVLLNRGDGRGIAPRAGSPRAISPAIAEAFFAGAPPESASPGFVRQQSGVAALDAVFAASQPELILPLEAQPAVVDVATLPHLHKGGQTVAFDVGGLTDPLAEAL